MLDDRKLKVLYAIINSHLISAEPIGSRTISKDYDFGVSSATIRNEMSDLEDEGYLTKPHSSAGRVPSDKAYRLYVDNVLKDVKLKRDKKKQEEIRKTLYEESKEVKELIKNSAEVLSKLTSYTSIVMLPELNKSKLKHIQLVLMEDSEILMVVVSSSGFVKNLMFTIEDKVGADELLALSNYLNEKFSGLSMSDVIQELRLMEIPEVYTGLRGIINNLIRALKDVNEVEVYANGVTKILNFPEYNDIEKAKSFMSFMEDKESMIDIMMQDDYDSDLEIVIGDENRYEEIKDCSVITASYNLGDTTIGRVGIIGPTRMDYLKLIGILRNFSDDISQVLTMLTK